MVTYSNYQDIPQFTRWGSYGVDHEWGYLEKAIESYIEQGLQMDPDFQRGHVWTEKQQIEYVEFSLRGGKSGRNILCNSPSWHVSAKTSYDDFVLVDGKQRLNAVLRFLRSEIPAFGTLRKDFTGRLRMTSGSFKWNVNDLQTRAEVLRWYLEINTGGTPHTEAEIDRVRRLLDAERTC